MASTVSLFSTSLKPFKTHRTKIAKQYTRLVALWPKDALRPTQSFTRAIEHRGQPYGLKPAELTPEEVKAKSKSKSKPAPASNTAPSNPQLEQAQVNALYSLLENRYSAKYPLSADLFKPRSAPQHYKKLMAEIESAPKKSWWEAKVDEWKMKIRWK